MKEIDENTPWYKQPLVWLVIVPPLAAVIAGIVTINLAIESDDGLVVDDYYKQGLGINQSLRRDQLARDMALDALLFVDQKTLKLRFNVDMNDPVLQLTFIHPTQGHRDVKVNLQRFSENAYEAELPAALHGNWNLLLEPEDKSWRISGRINLDSENSSPLLPN